MPLLQLCYIIKKSLHCFLIHITGAVTALQFVHNVLFRSFSFKLRFVYNFAKITIENVFPRLPFLLLKMISKRFSS